MEQANADRAAADVRGVRGAARDMMARSSPSRAKEPLPVPLRAYDPVREWNWDAGLRLCCAYYVDLLRYESWPEMDHREFRRNARIRNKEITVLHSNRTKSKTQIPSVAEQIHLAHPPLREAVVDLSLAEELPAALFNDIAARQLPGFGAPVPMWRGGLMFQIAPPPAPQIPVQQNPNEVFGLRYAVVDASRIVLLKRDGATFSVVQGYTTWRNARESAQAIWRQYCEWVRPAVVTRMAVRYINVLSVPFAANFDLYLTAGPRLPPGVGEVFTGFLQRVVVPFGEGTSAIITHALEPANDIASSVVLDIDVWREFRYDADSPDIWTTLDDLREIKNRIFFGSVTELALDQYR